MEAQLLDFLAQRSIQINPQLTLTQNIRNIIDQKELAINNLSQQITKYKCEEIKNEKLIKSLQDKISQLAPNISNTSSNFMMSSEFKTNFQEFMTTVLPTTLGWAIDKPYLFSRCTYDIFTRIYESIEQQVNKIVNNVCDCLKIAHLKEENKDLEFKIKLSLLKVLQQYWQVIFPLEEHNKYEYLDKSSTLPNDMLQEINEGVASEDYSDMLRQLHKLCIYMLLQDKPWEFINLNKAEIVKYSKKQHACIDGWIKEGEQALLLLGGIKKQAHLHPNLKNFVIPNSEDQYSQLYKELIFKIKQQSKSSSANKAEVDVKMVQSSPLEDSIVIAGDDVQLLPLKPVFIEQSDLISKNKSIQLLNNKENYPYALNKKSKKKDKLKFSMDSSLNLPQKSPKNILRRHDESIKNKKIEIEEIDERIYRVREESKAKKKSLMISKNIDANINQLPMTLKQKNVEDMPVSKQIHQKKKIKANTSRKNSVGKIVNQNHMINQDKENTQSINNSKIKNKQKVYKDIIKEKLLQDKIQDKTQHSLNILYPKSRTDRDKKKQENRPLKIQNNANKLRQKYIF